MYRFLFVFLALVLASHAFAEKGGLLGNLHAVHEDEAIHRGNFLTGATLFLLQGESDEDALNIIFGDIYKAEGYTFTDRKSVV